MTIDEALASIGKKKPDTEKTKQKKVTMIHYSKLKPNADNFYETDDIEKLAAAIRIAGEIKNPLRVCKTDIDEYEVNEGHRRRLATIHNVEKLGLKKFEFVPCIIDESNNLLNSINLILSNSTQRERTDFEKMTEVKKLRELLEQYAKENETKIPSLEMRQLISEILGVSKTKVAQLQSIDRNLIPEAKEKFERNEIPVSVAGEMASLDTEEQQKLVDNETLQLPDVKKVKKSKKKKYKSHPCEYVKNVECNIEEIMEKHFTKKGNIIGCAGCCKFCLHAKECEHICTVAKINNADLKDQMNLQDIKPKEEKYFSEKEIKELTFNFSDVKKILWICKKDIKQVSKMDNERAVQLKIIVSSLERLLKELVVKDNGE